MGGFEGGDEGGFWDDDILANSVHQTQNKNYLKLKSSVQRTALGYSIKIYKKDNWQNDADTKHDTISFVSTQCESLTIETDEHNTHIKESIYTTYNALIDFTNDFDIEEFFHEHKVVIKKNINNNKEDSYSQAFLYLTKDACNLTLTNNELDSILNY